jgi:hypothetical protein
MEPVVQPEDLSTSSSPGVGIIKFHPGDGFFHSNASIVKLSNSYIGTYF